MCSSDLLVGGGVAANGRFRERLEAMCKATKSELFIAPREMCTDNAAMGAIAWELFEKGHIAPLNVDVTPGLVRKPKAKLV